jgi:hypothetical protein
MSFNPPKTKIPGAKPKESNALGKRQTEDEDYKLTR